MSTSRLLRASLQLMLALSTALGCGSTSGAGPGQSSPGGAGNVGNGGAANSGGGGQSGAVAAAGTTAAAGGAAGGDTGTAPTGGGNAGGGGGAFAAAGNAGATDASGSAGMGRAGGGTCVGVFCEDFESGALDPAVWDVQANGGQTVKVQPGTVAHGKYAVQFHGAPNVVSYDFIITKHAPAALQGQHYGRAYFLVTPKPPQQHTEFIFAGSSGFPKLKYLEVAESGLDWQLTYVQLVAPTGETYKGYPSAIPLAKWACLEWEMNDAPDQISVSVDGTKQATFDSIAFMSKSTGLVGGFSDFGFGFYIWHPATYAFDVYYDDIVLDTKPIGCLAP